MNLPVEMDRWLTVTLSQLENHPDKRSSGPFAALWPETLEPHGAMYFSQSHSVLWGTPWAETATQSQWNALSFWEAVNFFSLNVHGETHILEAIPHLLAAQHYPDSVLRFLDHFAQEEADHRAMFTRFCESYGGGVLANRMPRLLLTPPFPIEADPITQGFRFFSRIVVFERLVDGFNRHMAKDPELHPLVQEIHNLHHTEEARHLGFGIPWVVALWEAGAPGWSHTHQISLLEELRQYVSLSLRQLYSPEVFERGLGDSDPYGRMVTVWDHPAQRIRRETLAHHMIKPLIRGGIPLGDHRTAGQVHHATGARIVMAKQAVGGSFHGAMD